jgi:glycerol uptake operon antiterminator
MDLIEGIGKDASGLHFAKEEFGLDGVQSTKAHILKMAKHEKLITVHDCSLLIFSHYKAVLTLPKYLIRIFSS